MPSIDFGRIKSKVQACPKTRHCGTYAGREVSAPRGMGEEPSPGSDHNSNLPGGENCISTASSQDFVQDNSDYQWFLDYGYRYHPSSILSSGCYDDLALDLDANLAQVDMEDFRSEDIHSVLSTLPAMCCGEMQAERGGEMFASVSGSLMARFELDSSLSPHSSSQGSADTMSLCKSELLFSPVRECQLPPNFSVDSLDCDLLSGPDILLTCQANKDNYTIAFEGSTALYSEDSDYHEAGDSEATSSESNRWPSHFIRPLDTSMARSDSVYTTWSKLKKRTSQVQLSRHPSGNNNNSDTFLTGNATALKSQSLPNLCRQRRRSGLIMSTSVESDNAPVRLFDSGKHHFSLLRLFMKQRSNEGMCCPMEQSSASECWPNSQSEADSDSYAAEIRQPSSENRTESVDNGNFVTDNSNNRMTMTNNWIHAEDGATDYSTCGFEDSLVQPVKEELITNRQYELIEEVEEEEERSESVEQLSESFSKIEESATSFVSNPNRPRVSVNNNNSLEVEEASHESQGTQTHSSTDSAPLSYTTRSTATQVPVQIIHRGIQTSEVLATPFRLIESPEGTSLIKIMEPSSKCTQKGELKKPVYVFYPNYTLPDLTFLRDKRKELDVTSIFLMPQKCAPSSSPKREPKKEHSVNSKQRRPFSCPDVKALRKKGFSHIQDWASLTFLLPREYRRILADVPEVGHHLKGLDEEALRPLFCVSPPLCHTKPRPASCDCAGLTQDGTKTNVSSSSSTATQPSSGYRGSSTILSDSSSQNQHIPQSQHNNPLFVYRYDSISSESGHVSTIDRRQPPALPKRSISLEATPPRPPLPRGILRKSRHVSADTAHTVSDEMEDEGVDTDSSSEGFHIRPPTPPIPRVTEQPSKDMVQGVDEVLRLEEFLQLSGLSPATSECMPWDEAEMARLRLQVSRFLSARRDKKSVSFAESVAAPQLTPPNSPNRPYQGKLNPTVAEIPIQEEAEGSPEPRPLVTVGHSPELEHKKELITTVADSVSTLVSHLTAPCPAHARSASLVLEGLCPALYAVLSDGLRPSLDTAFGPVPNSVWQVVEASVQQGGPMTKDLNDLVLRLNSEDVLTEGLLKFNAFVIGLLNVRALDAWAGYLRTRESVLRKHYVPNGLLPLAISHPPARALADGLLSSLRALSRLPFELDLLHECRQLHRGLSLSLSQPLPDLLSPRPRSFVESNRGSLVSDIADTVRRRWSGIQLGSRLFQAFDRLIESEQCPDSLESELEPESGGKFRRLQRKWEMLSGKDSSPESSPSPPAHSPGTVEPRSRIPRPVTSPVRVSGIPVPQSRVQLRKPPISGVKPKTKVSDEVVLRRPRESPATRPSNLPQPTAGGPRPKVTPPPVSGKQPVLTDRWVRTVSHRLPSDSGHLSFGEGDRLRVVLEVDSRWLLCCRGDRKGLVPRASVVLDSRF